MKRLRASCVGIALLLSSTAAIAQTPSEPALQLNEKGYFEGPAVNVLAFSNWYDGLFADAKISGIEIIQQGMRTATNGDVRLSATPGQWDAIGALVDRKVDAKAGVVETTLRYAAHDWQYVVRAERRGGAVELSIIVDKPVPRALAGKAGFNLELLPSAYFHHAYMADERTGTFPIYPASAMERTAERNAASGRSEGPGA